MTQLLTAAGGTRAWRRLVAEALARDGYSCRMRRDGRVCGLPATTANHIVPRIYGGLDELSNLEAACVPCNMGAGAKLRGRAGLATVENHNAVVALVRFLDTRGEPHTVGRAGVLALIRAHGAHPYSNAQMDAAVRFRRARGPLTRL